MLSKYQFTYNNFNMPINLVRFKYILRYSDSSFFYISCLHNKIAENMPIRKVVIFLVMSPLVF